MGDDAMTSLRLPAELLERADRLAEGGLGTGARVSRAVVLRRALEVGLASLSSGAPASVASLELRLAELASRVDRMEASSGAGASLAPLREAARRILAELAADGVSEEALLNARAAATVHPLTAEGRRLLADLRLALAELESPEGLGTDGAAALARVAR